MKVLALDPLPPEIEQLLERRRHLGLDGCDEVWEGVYHMAPMARGRHGYVQDQIAELLRPPAREAGLVPTGRFNLGDSEQNFRVPDYGCHRRFDPETVYFSSAAVVGEIVSPGDETYEKLPFYAAHGVDEVFVVEPDRRRVRILALTSGAYAEEERSALLGVEAKALGEAIRWG